MQTVFSSTSSRFLLMKTNSFGAIADVSEILAGENSRRVLMVIDEEAYRACGAADVIEPALHGHSVSRFSEFELNPRIADVDRGIELAKQQRPELVIAIGGGTALDLGKLISRLAVQPASSINIIQGTASLERPGSLERAGIPLVAIPTTAGTGSEATHFAVVYVDGEKHSVADPLMLPDYAIIDPRLTYSLPAGITAATGLDAFCQGIESMWSVRANDESIGYASEAIRLASQNIVAAVNTPTPSVRDAMCRASHLAGKAINITTTTSSHALSYSITSDYGIPHGIAVALTLAPMLRFNANVTADDCMDPRGASHVRNRISAIVDLLGATSVENASERFSQIVRSIGCPATLSEASITTDAQIKKIVASVNTQRMANNPRRATEDLLLHQLSTSLNQGVSIG
ncbi:bifunctional acetaldehyde-CoA/alcohol dehydrogenase [Rhodopirellula sp. SWK7]|nr:bifunctional acetaldehyde-CoA/alcohol dehydrogenase [Rhodopirellula sp. SWK7]